MKVQQLNDSRARYASGYYPNKLKQGQEFQDFVTCALYERGVVLINFESKKFQFERGENLFGAEIKRDDNFRESGNLYIETAEKSHPNKQDFIPSGIYRDDNSWLFIIGDEETFWIFGITHLRRSATSAKYRHVETPTSRGFLLPVVNAEALAIRKVEIPPAPSVSPFHIDSEVPF